MIRKAIVLLLLACSLGLVPAHAAASGEVEVSAITPTYLQSPTDITVALTVTSPQDANVTSTVALGDRPLIGRSQLTDAMRSQLDWKSHTVVQNSHELSEGVNSVEIVVPKTALADMTPGVQLLTVSISGIGSSQVVLPYFPARPANPLQVVTLLPLTAAPALLGDHRFTSAKSLKPYAEDGALNQLLSGAANESDVTWLLDPDVVETAQALRDGGYLIDGEQVDGNLPDGVQSGASSLLDALKSSTTAAPMYLLPFAAADINALVTAGRTGLAGKAIGDNAAARTLLGRANLAQALVAARGDFGTNSWSWLSDQSPRLRVVGDKSWPSATDTFTSTSVIASPDGGRALVVDSQASRWLGYSLRADQRHVRSRQALFADLLLIQQEQPSSARVLTLLPSIDRGLLASTSVAAALNALRLPWVKAVAPTEALSQPTSASRTRVGGTIRAAFNSSYLTTLGKLESRRQDLKALVGGTVHDSRLLQSELRLTSAAFNAPHERQLLREQTVREINNIESAVNIISTGSVAFSGETGRVPITVRNDLAIDVTVKVLATGVPVVRVLPEVLDPITIGAGKRKSVEIATRLVGSDTASMNLQLVTTDGHPLGPVVAITLTSSAYSKVAGYVVIGASILLVLLIFNNLVRRLRRRSSKVAL